MTSDQQEFVKKRKEAAASMSNLKMVPTNSVGPIAGPCGRNGIGNETDHATRGSGGGTTIESRAILRKTASESNLLKMKPGRRGLGGGNERGGPYSRLMSGGPNPNLGNTSREPSIPETFAISMVNQQPTGNDSLQGSPSSIHSNSSLSSVPGGVGNATMSGGGGGHSSSTRPPLARDLSLTSTAENFTGSSAPTSPKVVRNDSMTIY